MNGTFAHEEKHDYEGEPILVDWRSQDLGSMGQPNCNHK